MSRSEDWKLLNRVHYQALRIAMRDFQQEVPRKQLDTLGRRATPQQWGYYATASTAANILWNREPSLLFDLIHGNMTTNRRRPARPNFFDTSRRKIGRQSLHNRIGRVEADWMEAGRSKDAVRVDLKNAFFPYYMTEAQTT